ncbi:hypothetical protein K1719_046599 [Acacia pycnantha]|nr:hypothetical protein K1719_046599 [Acacia pycnantha]
MKPRPSLAAWSLSTTEICCKASWVGCSRVWTDKKTCFLDEHTGVVIDNAVCSTVTLVKVDRARRHGILLDDVQVLSDRTFQFKGLHFLDGKWFMDVFHVTDQNGSKLTDENILRYIENGGNEN